MHYTCLNQQHFDQGAYRLVPMRYQDIMQIKQWRNEQIGILRQQTPLTNTQQEEYYQNVVIPGFKEHQPRQILMSFLFKEECIGYGALVHIDWENKQAEVSFLVDTQRAANPSLYKLDFSNYLQLIKQLAFQDLHFKRLYAETYDIRAQHVEILESQGFILEKRLKDHVVKEGKTMDSLIHGCVS